MTIAQQLKITEFPFEIKDSKGNLIYYEDSTKFWVKHEYDAAGNLIYWEDVTEFWVKREFDTNGDCIYYENSSGQIFDNRPMTEV